MKMLVTIALLAGATPWAGLTRPQVIPRAISDTVAMGVAFGQLTPAKAAKARVELARTPAVVSRVRCQGGGQAWKVVWPKSDPVYLTARRMLLSCR